MRFDLVDLQLFIAVADARSITRGADRAHLALASASARIKGLEDALGVALLKRGRRGVELTAAGESLLDHARLIMHNVDAMRGDLAGFASGVRASVHLLANTSGLSEHLPKALAAFLREHPRYQHRRRGARKHRYRDGDRQPAPPISDLPPNTRCPTPSSGSRSARIAWRWWRRAAARSPAGGRSTFRRWPAATSSA